MALNIRAAEAAIARGSRNGLQRASEHLLGVSRERVPIEEGDLSRSGRPTVLDDEHATVGYGGAGLDDYAVRQHEELTWRHDPGRTAKYLENPLTEEAATLKALMAEAVREQLR